MNQGLVADYSSAIAAVDQDGLFTSLCTIKAPPETGGSPTVDGTGQVDLTNFSDRAGLVDIPCMMSVLMPGKAPSESYERREVPAVREMNYYHVLLNGYYTGIEQRDMAVIDGTPLDVLNAESDSQKTMTRLAVRRYEL
jgi:hypothetical protein